MPGKKPKDFPGTVISICDELRSLSVHAVARRGRLPGVGLDGVPRPLTISVEGLAHGADMRRAACDSLRHGRVDILGGVPVEQTAEMEGHIADIPAPLGDEAHQRAALGDRVVEPLEGAVLARLTLESNELFEMRGGLVTRDHGAPWIGGKELRNPVWSRDGVAIGAAPAAYRKRQGGEARAG